MSVNFRELQKWDLRLSAEVWDEVTWRWLMLDIVFTLAWLGLVIFFFALLFSRVRARLGIPAVALVPLYFVAQIVGMWGVNSLFGDGPLGAIVLSLTSPEQLKDFHEFGYKYFTILGLVASDW